MNSNSTKVLSGSPELRARLPHGGVGMIARKYNVSWVWAYRIIMGYEDGRPEMVEDANRLAEAHEQLKAAI